MAKLCPMNGNLCTSECAWWLDGECAVTRLAVSMYDKEMKQRFINRYLPNAFYGVCGKGFDKYTDTDSVKEKDDGTETPV